MEQMSHDRGEAAEKRRMADVDAQSRSSKSSPSLSKALLSTAAAAVPPFAAVDPPLGAASLGGGVRLWVGGSQTTS